MIRWFWSRGKLELGKTGIGENLLPNLLPNHLPNHLPIHLLMQMLKQMLRQIGHLHAYADTDLPVLIMHVLIWMLIQIHEQIH